MLQPRLRPVLRRGLRRDVAAAPCPRPTEAHPDWAVGTFLCPERAVGVPQVPRDILSAERPRCPAVALGTGPEAAAATCPGLGSCGIHRYRLFLKFLQKMQQGAVAAAGAAMPAAEFISKNLWFAEF